MVSSLLVLAQQGWIDKDGEYSTHRIELEVRSKNSPSFHRTYQQKKTLISQHRDGCQ